MRVPVLIGLGIQYKRLDVDLIVYIVLMRLYLQGQ